MPEPSQPLSEKESLQLITEMIGKAKSSFHSNGTSAILWGSVIFFCSIVTFLQLQFTTELPFDVWWLQWLAVVPQVIFIYRNRGNRKAVGYEETTMTYTWLAFAASVLLLMFYVSLYQPGHAASLYLLIFGIPTFITGGACQFRPMLIGGLICWILFLVSLHTPLKINMLLMALAALSAWLIPGLLLRKRYREAAQNTAHGV
ncbi:MAG: hypothetical protein U0X40_01335 [Ferruginibacter sp.]